MKATLEDWIPKILAAQEPDGYLQTAFTLRRAQGALVAADIRRAITRVTSPATSSNRRSITTRSPTARDLRLYNAAKKLADCWVGTSAPSPARKSGIDGHQEMEQALVRFGRFVNDMEGGGKGDAYIKLAKFLLDCRRGRQRIRPEPRARAAAVRSGRARRAGRVQLLRHGRRRHGNRRPRLPQRRDVVCGTTSPTRSTTSPAASAAAKRPKASAPTIRSATTPTANRARAAGRFSSSTR